MRLQATAEWMWAIPRVGAPRPAGAGRIVVPVTTYDLGENTGRTRLWMVEETGAGPVALTRPDADATAPAVSPDRTRLAFLRKVDGVAQVHVMRLDGGEPERVTDLPLGGLGIRWLPDGSGLVLPAPVLRDHPALADTRAELERRKASKVTAHTTEHAIYRYWHEWLTGGEVPHVFHLDLTTGELRDLTPGWTGWWAWPSTNDPLDDLDVSPDGTEVAFSADFSEPPHRTLRWGVFTVPLAGGEVRPLTSAIEWHAIRPRYAPDGGAILYGLQRTPGFYADRIRLVRYDRRSEEHTVLTEEWDHSADGWSFAGDRIVLLAEERGRTPLFEMPSEGGIPSRVAVTGTLRAPVVGDDGTVYALAASLSAPPEVVAVRDGTVDRVTSFTSSALAGWEPAATEELEVAGHEGRPVQVFLLRPPGEGPHSLVHLIHGGPHGVFGDDWHWRWNAQVFAAAGHAVAMVNFHGSTGFGQEFTESILGRWGDQPYADVEAATDHLVAAGIADPARMAVTGGSYGGYLVAWITSQTDRYACAVAHAAVTDLVGMYASDIVSGHRREFGAEAFEDLEQVQRWNPAAHAAGFATPTLVVHGERDFRVPATQGLALYGMLQSKGVPARLVHYPDEHHWILSPANSLHWYGEVLGWLERHLT
jgi:dipeptidyl aminopeptidase/acylaminoacyl peptidase